MFIDGLFARIASDPWTGSILIATFAAAFGALLGFLLHRVSGEAEPTPAPTLLAPPRRKGPWRPKARPWPTSATA